MVERNTGTVKWFNVKKGFGFIQQDGGGEDVFLHHSVIREAGHPGLTEGDRIEFTITHSDKGPSASKLVPANGAVQEEVEAAPAADMPRGRSFDTLGLIDPLLRAVKQEGYTTPTPIQIQAIPHVLEGSDLMGCAQTGTGKTAAFALPILQRLATSNHNGRGRIRVLVLSPTRELSSQIGESFRVYGRNLSFRSTVVFGGVGQQPQVAALRKGVDILVATPGRLLDLMNQGFVRLDGIETFVLDEADQMLDMGFIHDVRKVIAALPKQRQTLMFSATMPTEIVKLSQSILRSPVSVSVTPDKPAVEIIEQSVLFLKDKKDKQALLEHLLRDPSITRTLVFTRTKHGADKVVRQLARASISAEPIHGNRSQNARTKALSNFKSGRTRVLVATDVAARGIDIDEISHVIQFDLPEVPETYVHRIGRTGRAGAGGNALAFCSPEERSLLKDIEKLLRRKVPVVETPTLAKH